MFEKNMAIPAILVFMFSPEFSNGLINKSEQNHISAYSVPNEMAGDRTGRSLYKECESGSINPKCLKIHALSWIEDISSRNELPLLPGLSIVKENQTNQLTTEEVAAELSRQFPGNPEEKLNRFLMYRLKDYLDGHSLKYKLADQQTTEESNAMAKGDNTSVESARGKGGGGGGGGFGGGKGGGGGFLAAALMMKGTLAAAAIAALALLAGKALMTALLSLLLSALLGMKGHGGGGKTHYEIITKPEVSHHHTHSQEEHHEHEHGGHHGGYRRAYDPVTYNSYMPYDTANYPNTTS